MTELESLKLILFEKVREKERCFFCWFIAPNGHNSQGWDRLKSETKRNSLWVFQMIGRNSVTWAIICYITVTLARSWIGSLE